MLAQTSSRARYFEANLQSAKQLSKMKRQPYLWKDLKSLHVIIRLSTNAEKSREFVNFCSENLEKARENLNSVRTQNALVVVGASDSESLFCSPPPPCWNKRPFYISRDRIIAPFRELFSPSSPSLTPSALVCPRGERVGYRFSALE